MFLCGGGTNPAETYIDVAYFYGHEAVQLPSLKSKPYLFITGDQSMHDEVRERDLPVRIRQQIDPSPDPRFTAGRFNADGMPEEGTWDKLLIWQSLMKKYHVFHVQKPGYGNLSEWSTILGPERVLKLTTAKACVDCMLGAIALTSGARTLEEYVEDLKERGQDEARRIEISAALAPYWESIARAMDAAAATAKQELSESAGGKLTELADGELVRHIGCKCGFRCNTEEDLDGHVARFTGDNNHEPISGQ